MRCQYPLALIHSGEETERRLRDRFARLATPSATMRAVRAGTSTSPSSRIERERVLLSPGVEVYVQRQTVLTLVLLDFHILAGNCC